MLRLLADSDPEEFDTSLLPTAVLSAVEADSFWCLSRLLDGIQDNYISAQPGIQRSVKRMAELVARIDGKFFSTCAQWLLMIEQPPCMYTSSPKMLNSCSSLSAG
jgi:hypothetical protein